jgi:FkbM family methyltransferase
MKQDINSLNRWFEDRGDYTHNLNYDLNGDSVVVDLGGYQGLWIDEILKKTSPNIPKILLVEPVPLFYNQLVSKFTENEKIKVMNVGVSTNNKETTKTMYVSGDGSSTNFNTNVTSVIQIKTIPIEKILLENNINHIDLLQINIEGDEYDLLEYMIENDIINVCKNIQVQFHLGIENCVERRSEIQKSLSSRGFKNKFDYPFVWESWYSE